MTYYLDRAKENLARAEALKAIAEKIEDLIRDTRGNITFMQEKVQEHQNDEYLLGYYTEEVAHQERILGHLEDLGDQLVRLG